MSRNDLKLPWRVVAISALLFVALAVLGWRLLGSGGAPGAGDPPAAAAPAGQPADPEAGARGGAGEAASGAGTASAGQPPASTAPVFDPSNPESRASLSRARSDRGTMELQLFLIVPGLEQLVPVSHTVAAPAGLDAQVRRAVQELILWSGTQAVSPLPPEAGIREVWVSPAGIAYVDFDRRLRDFAGGGALGELHIVYGVVSTVVISFPEVFAVQLLVEGDWIETLTGHVDLAAPLVPSNEWVLLEPRERRLPESDGD